MGKGQHIIYVVPHPLPTIVYGNKFLKIASTKKMRHDAPFVKGHFSTVVDNALVMKSYLRWKQKLKSLNEKSVKEKRETRPL